MLPDVMRRRSQRTVRWGFGMSHRRKLLLVSILVLLGAASIVTLYHAAFKSRTDDLLCTVRSQHSPHRADFCARPEPRRMGAGRDLYGLRREGTEFPVEIGLAPLETEEGLLVLGSIVDVTDRKQAEEELQSAHVPWRNTRRN